MLYYLVAFCAVAGLGASAQNFSGVSQANSGPSIRPFYVDMNRMAGKWYLQLVSSNTNPDTSRNGERCQQDYWTATSDCSARVVLSAFSPYLNGYSEVVNDLQFNNNAYNMTVRIPVIEDAVFYHYILDTDYNNYVIYYVYLPNSGPAIWMKTREQSPKMSMNNIAQNAMRRNGLPYVQLTQVNQRNC